MTRLIKIMLVWAVMLTTWASADAVTRTIRVSTLRGELTQALRDQLKGLTYNDLAIIQFDQNGTYTIKGTIEAQCNIKMTGKNRKKTIILLDKGQDKPGFKAFHSYTYFFFRGTNEHPITVELSNFTIQLAQHQGLWFQDYPFHAVEIYHANKVKIYAVDSYMQNAAITNFDLRVCSGVEVNNCLISNINNCQMSGNLWLRGATSDVNIHDNRFVKYGNDEAIAIWDRQTNAYDYDSKLSREVTKRNVRVANNVIDYGYKGKDKAPMVHQVLFAVFTDYYRTKYPCHFHGLYIEGNTFNITDPISRTLTVAFDPADEHSDIYVRNNTFNYKYKKSDLTYQKNDIDIHDESLGGDPIHFTDNVTNSYCEVESPFGTNGNNHVLMHGGVLDYARNTLNGPGTQFMWIATEGGDVTLTDNYLNNVNVLASVSSGDSVAHASITATGNYITGKSEIYCKNVKRLDLNFTSNTMQCTSGSFFLQDFATEGNVVFNYNTVTIANGGGHLMTYWGKGNTAKRRFKRLEVVGNSFQGVDKNSWLKHFLTVDRREVRNNSFR